MKTTIIFALKFLLYITAMLMAVLIIRIFLFGFYVVPSDSMEPSILSGDFIAVNKTSFGARIFTGLKFDRYSDPSMVRVPGFGRIRRNDILVFNFPYHHKRDTIRMDIEKIYVKRCIGLPGDSVSAVAGLYHVAGFTDTLGCVSEQKKLANQSSMFTTPTIFRAAAFHESLQWNIINFGPFYVPAAGKTIALTPENIKLYHKLFVYEIDSFIHRNDTAYINNVPTTHYTFLGNWYFVAGDKALSSIDSRQFGLLPEAYIIGKARRVMWSKDVDTGKRRWDRTLKKIR